MVEQDRDVLAPLAKRRQLDLDRVEPEQQVLAEPRLVRQLVGGNIGRGNDAHVDGDRLVGADRHHLALLERGQELGLQLKRKIADLVEEKVLWSAALSRPIRSPAAPVNAPLA